MQGIKMLKVSEVIVPEKRFRTTIDECAELAKSIQEIGLIHPIVVDSHNTLIVGGRRLQAHKYLHLDTIAARVVDYDDPKLVERDENNQRINFTPREAREVRRHFLAIEKEKAKERQKEHGGTAPGKKNTLPKFGTVLGRAKDRASAATGYSADTLDKVDVVIEAAEAEPEKFAAVAEEMEATGKVDPAYKKVQAEKKPRRTKDEIEAARKKKCQAYYRERCETVCGMYEDLPREWRTKVREFIAKIEREE